MAIAIGLILVVITLLIIGLILRKRVYDNVDRQEVWKLDIMNRNTASEIARIKDLNLSGETLEKFESWKDRWENILTKELPNIEELLYEAEEAGDRYRFLYAKKVVHKVDETLHAIEKDIEKMLAELEELLDSERTSRNEMDAMQPELQNLRKQLARGKYGQAKARLLSELDEMTEVFTTYNELVDSGDYIEAKKNVDQLKVDLTELDKELDILPALLEKCSTDLPGQLHELYSGIQGMKRDGYRVDHLQYEDEIQDYQARLLDCIKSLEKGSIAEVNVIIFEIEERMKEMYEQLEQEALDKNYIESRISNYEQDLGRLGEIFEKTKEEVDSLRKAYYFEDRDMERYLLLEKSMKQLEKQYEELEHDLESKNTAHSRLREQLDSGFDQLAELKEDHKEFKELISNLRKDELEAKAKFKGMREQVNELHRNLKKSNLPGIPRFIWEVMEAATMRNNAVIKALEKQPLDISEVQQAITEAEAAIENAVEQTEVILDQAYLTEQVIQYANRYRSADPALATKLAEAERLFRSYEYELSLEHAANAIEEIEPGSLKKIEENQLAL
ncbi:MAG TPA: septation ring formation regulator EzrA [Virgibacillus sp.]|nr:septation ring formation regulator EzrA [Virgibacillus sp.]